LRHIPTLSSDEPEDIFVLIIKLDEIYALIFVGDSVLLVPKLPLVTGAVFGFFGEYLLSGSILEQCKCEPLKSSTHISLGK